MAVCGVLLGTHDGDAELGHAAFEALDGFEEGPVLRHAAVEGAPVGIIVFGFARAAAEPIAQVEVFEASLNKCVAEQLAVKLGAVAGVGRGPDIDENLNVVDREQAREVFK